MSYSNIDINGMPTALIIHDRRHLHDLEEFKLPDLPWLNKPHVDNDLHKTSLPHWLSHYDIAPSITQHLGVMKTHLIDTQDRTDRGDPHALKRNDAILGYTRNSTHLNKTLYHNHLNGNPNPEHILSGLYENKVNHHLPTLDNAVEHHRLQHDMHVYSGVHFHPGEVASRHPDRQIILPAYTSTTIDKHIGKMYARKNTDSNDKHILKFDLKAGQKGHFTGYKSVFPTEQEYILPRNTKIHVEKHPLTLTDHENGMNFHIHTAHVLH